MRCYTSTYVLYQLHDIPRPRRSALPLRPRQARRRAGCAAAGPRGARGRSGCRPRVVRRGPGDGAVRHGRGGDLHARGLHRLQARHPDPHDALRRVRADGVHIQMNHDNDNDAKS